MDAISKKTVLGIIHSQLRLVHYALALQIVHKTKKNSQHKALI